MPGVEVGPGGGEDRATAEAHGASRRPVADGEVQPKTSAVAARLGLRGHGLLVGSAVHLAEDSNVGDHSGRSLLTGLSRQSGYGPSLVSGQNCSPQSQK